ncbi:hypothetical protein ACIRQP_26140 [Streptomyces sp. NPDC102274]|uniref:hypothetical protein n=1 Tax=Streptomyces sp. NPDC102274 TaxID=3366151 RepID=UPI0038275E5C
MNQENNSNVSKKQTVKAAKGTVKKAAKGASVSGERSQVTIATNHVRAYDRNAGKTTDGQ